MLKRIELAYALAHLFMELEGARVQKHLQHKRRFSLMAGTPDVWIKAARGKAELIHKLRADGVAFPHYHDSQRPHPTDTDFIELVQQHAAELAQPMSAEQYAASKLIRRQLHKMVTEYHRYAWDMEQDYEYECSLPAGYYDGES